MTPIEKDSLVFDYGSLIKISDEEVPYIKTEQDLIRKLEEKRYATV